MPKARFPARQTYRCALHVRIEGEIVGYAIVILFQADLEVTRTHRVDSSSECSSGLL